MKLGLMLIFLSSLLFAGEQKTDPYKDIYYEKANKYSLLVKDSIAIYVHYKEKYGLEKFEIGTILMKGDGEYVLTKRNSEKIRFTIANTTILGHGVYREKEGK